MTKSCPDDGTTITRVNTAQAYKWSGSAGRCEALIKKTDWLALGTDFKLAKAVLEPDFENTATLMVNIGSGAKRHPDAGEYQEWPLFQEFRESQQFRRAYKKAFKVACVDRET